MLSCSETKKLELGDLTCVYEFLGPLNNITHDLLFTGKKKEVTVLWPLPVAAEC
jgi:hypothetical protein